jgi:hypothetical protein
MKKKLSLNVKYTPEYSMLGISTPLSDFKLVGNMNNVLDIGLKKIPDFPYSIDDSKQYEPFSIYYIQRASIETDYYLIANKSSDAILIPEYKQFDYFFLLKCCDSKRQMTRIIHKIKDIENVQTVFLIEMDKIKFLNNLFNELELHLLGAGC